MRHDITKVQLLALKATAGVTIVVQKHCQPLAPKQRGEVLELLQNGRMVSLATHACVNGAAVHFSVLEPLSAGSAWFMSSYRALPSKSCTRWRI